MKSHVTATISTKDRYFTSLPNCLIAIATQTVVPDKVLIFDDGEHKDLRNEEIYKNIFSLFNDKGIEWEVAFGEGKGQVLNHQKALDIVKTHFIWRLDDDNVAEANVLEKLLGNMDSGIGAVAGLVIDPKMELKTSKLASNNIENIYLGMNEQWFDNGGTVPYHVDHLYSSFLFRVEAASGMSYNLKLSPKGHREETLFTYEMKRNGWGLIIDPTVTTWHFRNSQGGIRSGSNDTFLYEHDENIFREKLKEWGVIPKFPKLVVLDCGLGDTCVFAKILLDMKKKYPHIIVANCYQELFEDDKDIINISIAEAKMLCDIDQLNIYRKMIDWGWEDSLENAFRKLYL